MRFVVDCSAALKLAAENAKIPAKHELLAPTLLRSQALSAMHEEVSAGKLEADIALERLQRLNKLPIRLLGDAVLRRQAWKVADQLGWTDTYDAEYVALTQLQADAFVTLDRKLAQQVKGLVETAPLDSVTA